MDNGNFFVGLNDINLRDKLRGLFNYAEKEAKSFTTNFNNWVPIKSVQSGGNEWSPDGNIEINNPVEKKKINDLGVLFHEIFHSAFHKSPLWSSNGEWGDPFCDAFRYFIAEKIYIKDKFYKKIRCEGYLKDSPDEILRRSRNKCWEIKYGIPAGKIICKAVTYDGFKKLWEKLNQEDKCSLEDIFGFRMKEYKAKHCNK